MGKLGFCGFKLEVFKIIRLGNISIRECTATVLSFCSKPLGQL